MGTFLLMRYQIESFVKAKVSTDDESSRFDNLTTEDNMDE